MNKQVGNDIEMNKYIRQIILPLTAALIWGAAFVAQDMAADSLGAFTINAVRAAVATVFLGILVLGARIYKKRKYGTDTRTKDERKKSRQRLFIGGTLCGVCLTAATSFQQVGMVETSAGKASFITALYIVLVPIFGLVIKRKSPVNAWIGVMIAAVGFYFLCLKEDFTVEPYDMLVLICAILFAIYILIVDRWSVGNDCIELSCIQFAVMTVLSSIMMFIFEKPSFTAIISCALPILFLGIMSSGIAYTLQIISQKGSNPTVVAILFSLESVFGALFSAWLIHNVLSPREYLGCALIFAAVILTQIPFGAIRKKAINK